MRSVTVAALTGIGASNAINIPVDANARVRVDKLRAALQARLDRGQAVYALVAIVGTTEEGAVDPLDEILALRDEFHAKGMSFVVHADAACESPPPPPSLPILSLSPSLCPFKSQCAELC